MNYYEFPNFSKISYKKILNGTIHMSHRLCIWAPPYLRILTQGPWSQITAGEAREFATDGRRRLNGGGEVEEEHQGVLPHPLVVEGGRERSHGGPAT